jgi:hypothetical protein
MTRAILTLGLAAALAGTAAAQYPVAPNPYPYSPYYQSPIVQPNVFNPRTQPLSPYLNLFNGLNNPNPALNYYYNVRPGTVGGTGLSFQNGGSAFPSQGMPARQPFFPQNAGDAPVSRAPAAGDVLAPAGHPVYFNNTFGAFGGGTGRGVAPGLSGVGTSAPPRRR